MATAATRRDGVEIAEGLRIEWLKIAELREQDVNAQVMQPREFERLTENVRQRGGLESLPYCAQPNGEGPVEIVSGHHRVRAAQAAGLKEVPVIVDRLPLTRSQIVAKQIAHNTLVGRQDETILRALLAEIDTVDDLLHTGLDEELLPVLDDPDASLLGAPKAEFDWRVVSFVFLGHQLEGFRELVERLEEADELAGVANVELYEAFVQSLAQYGQARRITSISTTVATLTELASERAAIPRALDNVRLEAIVSTETLPPAEAQKLAAAIAEHKQPAEHAWQTLVRLCVDGSDSPKRARRPARAPAKPNSADAKPRAPRKAAASAASGR